MPLPFLFGQGGSRLKKARDEWIVSSTAEVVLLEAEVQQQENNLSLLELADFIGKNHTQFEYDLRTCLQELEREEHRYHLHNEIKHDPGEIGTLYDWLDSGHAKRFADVFKENRPPILKHCYDVCGYQCKGIEECYLGQDPEKRKVHILLGD